MKIKNLYFISLLLLVLTACGMKPVSPTTPALAENTKSAVQATEPASTLLKTADGDLLYVAARFVDETPMETPAPGFKLLLIILERADKQAMDLERFQSAQYEIAVHGDDGSRTISTMGGFVGEEFAIGFRVPDTARTFRLEWGDNPQIEVKPGG